MAVVVLPEAVPPFTLTLEVTDEHIDELGHTNNLVYVRWVQDVAMAHSAAVGLDVAAYHRIGAVFVVRRHEIDYLRPALRGDRILVRTWLGSVFAAKCTRHTTIQRLDEAGKPNMMVAEAVTTWGCVETTTGRPTRIPDSVRLAFLGQGTSAIQT